MIKHIIFDLKSNKKFRKLFLKIVVAFLIIASVLIYLSSRFNFGQVVDKQYILTPQREITASSEFVGEVYFNKEVDSKIFTKKILEAVNSAKETIEVSVYAMDIREIIDAIKARGEAGVNVTLIIPKKKEADYKALYNGKNIKIIALGRLNELNEEESHMHHKFILIDSATADRNIIFGSSNFTALQEKYDAGFIIETKDPEIILSFKKEFDLLKNGQYGVKKFRNLDYKPFTKKINYPNGFLEIWFGPGFKENSIKSRMIDLIDSATNEIEIMSWVFNDEDVTKHLIDKARSGIKIKIISDDSYIWTPGSQIKEFLYYNENSKKDIDVISDSYDNFTILNKYYAKDKSIPPGFNPYLHHHTLIIDRKILLTGTNNWTLNGFYRNDEDIIVTDIDTVVNAFVNFFDFQYKKNKGEKLDFGLDKDSDGNPVIEIKQTFPAESRVLMYIEKPISAVEKFCLDSSLDGNNRISFSKECITDQTIIYIIDKNRDLLASEYLISGLNGN